MYQKCPICNGNGTVQTSLQIGRCTTCDGKKIIDTLTGRPPFGRNKNPNYTYVETKSNVTLDDLKDSPNTADWIRAFFWGK